MPTSAEQVTATSGTQNQEQLTFDQILQHANASNLISLLKQNLPIPDALTPAQSQRVKELLSQYHPDTLQTSPLIDTSGNPITIHRDKAATDGKAIRDQFYSELEIPHNCHGPKYESSSEAILRRVDQILENYPSHKQWQDKNLTVGTVKAEHVSASNMGVVGEEGLFAKQDIPAGKVMMFGGMLIEDPQEYEIDKTIRKLAGCDKFYSRKTPPLIEGMDASMKCNAAYLSPENDFISRMRGDAEKNNFSLVGLPCIRPENKQILNMYFLVANRTIKKGEQVCYMYGSGHPAYFGSNRE